MRRLRALGQSVLLLWATAATAAIPRTISYQGILRDAAGTVVADGNYTLTFKLYSVASGGSALWTENQTLAVADGVFNAALGSVTALTLDFNTPYWLGVAIGAAPELTPRIALAAAPYGLNADRLDGLSSESFAASTHTHTLDALSDVNAPAPSAGQVLTYNAGNWVAQAPAAGDDGDWVISGNDVYHLNGKVGIGQAPLKLALPPGKTQRVERSAFASRLQVSAATPGQEGGIYAYLQDSDNGSDDRAAVYALRVSWLASPGSGIAQGQTNNAVTGRNGWGDSYSFGVAGYTYFDSPNTGGVLGSNFFGSIWGALGHQDGSGVQWGLYTPNNSYIGGTATLGGFKLPASGGAGKVLTSDANGIGTWQNPALDGQWTTTGDNIYRSFGKVGIGDPPNKPAGGKPDDAIRAGRDAGSARLQVSASTPGQEGGIIARFTDYDNASDARAAIYGLRDSGLSNPGSGMAPWATNNAVTGWNSWGDSYSFGVAGYSYFDSPNTAGVLGANQDGGIWGALGYQDASYAGWGLYTPNNVYMGSRVGIGTTAPDRALAVSTASGNAVIGRVDYTGESKDFIGVEGYSVPTESWGIGGQFQGGSVGVRGVASSTPSGSSAYFGVHGSAYGGTGSQATGAFGGASGLGTNYGIKGYASGGTTNYAGHFTALGYGGSTNYGLYCTASGGTTSYAGYFSGNVHVNGTLSKAAGAFKIDHPLEPASKTLSHSFVESPDMKNVYDGIVVLGADGSAWVEMPAWFEALNRDFRYQLTAIGAPSPNLYIAAKIAGNRFQIAGGAAGLEVSWMVTGIRQDAYANAHRIPVEELKSDKDQGRYLNPEAFGQPETAGIDYAMNNPDLRKGDE